MKEASVVQVNKFKLPEEFVQEYAQKKPPFGLNGLGEFVYNRTYSRVKADGTKEQWFETVRRVVEGCYSIQKNHIKSSSLGWSDQKGLDSAMEMYDRMFNMKFLPPGRGLWAMGTDIIEKKGGAALNNCAFASTENIGDSPKEATKPFTFLMDMSMLGVGVGFDVNGAGKIKIQDPYYSNEALPYVIPDSREGWVKSLRYLLESYFLEDMHFMEFDYSQIRPKGAPIKTFGGEASGPEPLIEMHERIRTILDGLVGGYITITAITDIMNIIGCCVVAGNVRRTAEIVFGNPTDEYLSLKDYKWDADKGEMVGKSADRSAWGWASNNSIFARVGQNYDKVGKQTALNGEPGYFWLENAQYYSRTADVADFKDMRVKGANPCNEQSLESYELCCLVETFPTMCDGLSDFIRTLKFAYLYAKTVTLVPTHIPDTNRVMLRNRRIGTSMTDISWFIQKEGIHAFKQMCEAGYENIKYYDRVYSEWFCVPESVKSTSIKPSGSVSLLPGVRPGMHFPESNYYIRRVRVAKNSDLLPVCQSAGYHIEDSLTDPSSSIVEFPVYVEGRTVNDVSIWEQVSLAAFLQKYWSDNQVSCTVTFTKEEGKEIPRILDYFQYELKGISFLPKTEKGVYAQMPYEEINEERYSEMVSKLKPLNFSSVKEDSIAEKFCDNDSCTI